MVLLQGQKRSEVRRGSLPAVLFPGGGDVGDGADAGDGEPGDLSRPASLPCLQEQVG